MRFTIAVRARRVLFAAAGGVVAAGVLATPALAHVEVDADKAQAGAQNVTLTFTGEAESVTAGIVSERVVLPAGINPADVQLGKAPKGWKLTPGADGVTAAGPALKPRQDAVFALVVAQLPADSTTLVFKTVESYSDGKVSRWIDVPEEGQPEPDNPAPVLKVKAAAAPATTSAAPPTAQPSSQPIPSPAVSTTPAVASIDAGSDDSRTGLWILLGVVVVAMAATALLLARRHGRTSRP
ncbi:hypothetical protein DMB66_49105 [Actinoplanes sp. ATCC 53533]|uniref:DUF1775 domain-containing protein n=1 Tax=Actinoplanes sp. ATCC 53533 TaxID=1288362 RepID=UPI000F773B98|nr:DUF1775 domain-containing protein [Actinoplanes sp. ATCC 53533]RSM46796.1 hypothetical protein DMB66_49105 [Actinoplanes sp. ATCC 53533]